MEELQPLVEAALSQREIATRLGISQTTVRYWMGRHGLKSKCAQHPPLTHNSPRFIERSCYRHGWTTYVFEPSKNGYRCKKCRSSKVSKDRRTLKARLVQEAGGCCQRCGYARSMWALHFHHRDAQIKERHIGHAIRDRQYAVAKTEAAQCDLLCANCHAEIEEYKWQATAV